MAINGHTSILTLKTLVACKGATSSPLSLKAITRSLGMNGASAELKVRGSLESLMKTRKIVREKDKYTHLFVYKITQTGLDFLERENVEEHIREQEVSEV